MAKRFPITKPVGLILITMLIIGLAGGCNIAIKPKGDPPPSEPTAPPTVQAPPGPEGKMTLTLYFATKDARYLVPEKREVPKTSQPAHKAVEELIAGPKNGELAPTIPAHTKLKGIKIKDQIAYVDMSEELRREHGGGSSGEMLTIYSIINTLTTFPEIKKVQILIEGKTVESLRGHLDLTVPLSRNEGLIKK